MKFEAPCACTTLRRAARAVTAAYDAALAPSGLRITQFSILRKLGVSPDFAVKIPVLLKTFDCQLGLMRKKWKSTRP
jgi:hypothetical protein